MVFSLAQDGDKSVIVTHALTGTGVCGTTNINNLVAPFPLCKTIITDHRHVIAKMEFMTDGTPASIAANV
jgi:hypothetical protein